MNKLFILLITLCFSALAVSGNLIDKNRKQLHEISSDLDKYVKHEVLLDYFFNERISMLRVIDTTLTQAQIEDKFRAYIKTDYVPQLLRKYRLAYTRMTESKFDFCPKSSPMEIYPKVQEAELDRYNYGFQLSLCAYQKDEHVIVDYYSRMDDEGLRVTTQYIFEVDKNKGLILSNIKELQYVSIPLFIEGI